MSTYWPRDFHTFHYLGKGPMGTHVIVPNNEGNERGSRFSTA